jgi:hypothetical protein
MAGYDETELRVYIENKFWAGLTENQPIYYLKELAERIQPSVLLIVVPAEREQTLWRDICRRLESAGIAVADRDTAAGIVCSVTTAIGPILALTSWTKLLSALELEVADDQSARSDLLQLRALCEAADSDAFIPISLTDVTDQHTPAFILQLGSIVQASVDLAVTEGVLNINRLMPQASWERIGRYARFSNEQGVGIWFGIHFSLWKTHGGTPLWLIFSQSEFSRAHEARPLIEPWAAKEGIFTTWQTDVFAVAVDIEIGEDKDRVLRAIVDRLKMIADVLSPLLPGTVIVRDV